jgi:tRNA pseudouridine38-40 synthase
MRNIKFTASFNGMNYHGFQLQPNLPTIQGEIETALLKIFDENIKITGCSRTDAGVHARGFCFNAFINNRIPCDNLVRAMNTFLPSDIAVISCEEADEKFNARFSAVSKEYIYLVNNKKQRDVFTQSYHYPYKINLGLMREATEIFIGEHDFAAFCKSDGKNETDSTIREIFSFDIIENNGFIEFIIKGSGFLYNMVRIMAGTLIYINEGKRSIIDIEEAFKTGDREKTGKTLPPYGLYLNKVFYSRGDYQSPVKKTPAERKSNDT